MTHVMNVSRLSPGYPLRKTHVFTSNKIYIDSPRVRTYWKDAKINRYWETLRNPWEFEGKYRVVLLFDRLYSRCFAFRAPCWHISPLTSAIRQVQEDNPQTSDGHFRNTRGVPIDRGCVRNGTLTCCLLPCGAYRIVCEIVYATNNVLE